MPQETTLSALVVDDTKENRIILSRLLQRQNFAVECAENGKEAVEKTMQKNFDIVFMDLMMPIMNGLDATKEIRKNGYSGPIVAVTTATTEQAACLESGMNDFIAKPFAFDHFIQKLSEWLPPR